MSKGQRTKKQMIEEILEDGLYQEPVSQEQLYTYIKFVLTNQVETEEEAELIKELKNRVATLSDVTILVNTITKQLDTKITELMSAVQIQQSVLDKLGATDEMFKEAEEEYNESLQELRKQIEGQEEDQNKSENDSDK